MGASFKSAMRRLPSGVGVITAQGPQGPIGMAATSITSLTVEPPSMLFCVNRTAGLHAHLVPGCRLCVNLLADDQRDISIAFGGAVARESRFEIGGWTFDTKGISRLESAQANLSCVVDIVTPYFTHSIVIARVDEIRLSQDGRPLIYQDGQYI